MANYKCKLLCSGHQKFMHIFLIARAYYSRLFYCCLTFEEAKSKWNNCNKVYDNKKNTKSVALTMKMSSSLFRGDWFTKILKWSRCETR